MRFCDLFCDYFTITSLEDCPCDTCSCTNIILSFKTLPNLQVLVSHYFILIEFILVICLIKGRFFVLILKLNQNHTKNEIRLSNQIVIFYSDRDKKAERDAFDTLFDHAPEKLVVVKKVRHCISMVTATNEFF